MGMLLAASTITFVEAEAEETEMMFSLVVLLKHSSFKR